MGSYNAILITMLYLLGVVLLIILIVLGLKIIGLLDKASEILDDVNNKIKTLDGLFNAINMTTSTISSIGDRLVSGAANIFNKIFKRNRKIDEEEDIFDE